MGSPASPKNQLSETDKIFVEELIRRLETLARHNEEKEKFSNNGEQTTDAAAASTTTSEPESESESEQDPEIGDLTTHQQQEGQDDSHFAEGQSPAKSDTTPSSHTTSPNGLSPLDVDTFSPDELEAFFRDRRPR